MKFLLEIEIGNDAMKTGEDLKPLIETAAAQVRDYSEEELRQVARPEDRRRLADENGNTVGFWRILP